jgi:hypothetical protein
MLEPIKALMLQLLAVPSEPSLPAGSAETARVPRVRRYPQSGSCAGGGPAATLIGLVAAIVVRSRAIKRDRPLPHTFRLARPGRQGSSSGWRPRPAGRFVQLPLTLIPIILDWELRWYIVTDRSLRIREGVWKVSELTMTFANVQEVMSAGPLDRAFASPASGPRSAGGGRKPRRRATRERGEEQAHQVLRGVDGAPRSARPDHRTSREAARCGDRRCPRWRPA